jgi:hypothetical protein
MGRFRLGFPEFTRFFNPPYGGKLQLLQPTALPTELPGKEIRVSPFSLFVRLFLVLMKEPTLLTRLSLHILVKPLPASSRLQKVFPLSCRAGIIKMFMINQFERSIVPRPTGSPMIVFGKFFLRQLPGESYVTLAVLPAS